jgi:hypothetical protein
LDRLAGSCFLVDVETLGVSQMSIVTRELLATFYPSREAAQQVCDVLNEGPNSYHPEFRDRGIYSILVRDPQFQFIGYWQDEKTRNEHQEAALKAAGYDV